VRLAVHEFLIVLIKDWLPPTSRQSPTRLTSRRQSCRHLGVRSPSPAGW